MSRIPNLLSACFYQKNGNTYMKQAGGCMLVWKEHSNGDWELGFFIPTIKDDIACWTRVKVKAEDLKTPVDVYREESNHLSSASSPCRYYDGQTHHIVNPLSKFEDILG